jgi:outer membrane protein TolC
MQKIYPFLRHRTSVAVLAIVAVLGTAGCGRFGDFVRKRADRATYRVISDVQRKELGKAKPFTVDAVPDPAVDRAMQLPNRLDMGADELTTSACQIALSDALAIAMARNRAYQQRKETLFGKALELSKTRRDFDWNWFANGNGEYERSDSKHDTNPPKGIVAQTGAYKLAGGVSRVLATGATVGLDYAHTLTRVFGNDPSRAASNNLAFSLTQPLLRNAGRLVAQEALRQAERDMIYEVRDFQRYQQSFIIEVANTYYGLLQSRDQLRNAQNNYVSAVENADQVQMYVQAGMNSPFEADQARQTMLQSELNLTDRKAAYLKSTDEFKVYLGLPPDVDIAPAPEEFDRLTSEGIVLPDMDLKGALATALDNRLDLKTANDRMDDATRGVQIALRDFLPQLDFTYDYSIWKNKASDSYEIDDRDHSENLSVDFDLPLDWTVRRNNYRAALLDADRAKRNYEEDRDRIILDVRDAWRELERLRKNYEINKEAVRLAERQVESTRLFFKEGTAKPRDVLEAQDDLLSARNSLTKSLVDYTIQRLNFWNTIERLDIDPRGTWYEGDEAVVSRAPQDWMKSNSLLDSLSLIEKQDVR